MRRVPRRLLHIRRHCEHANHLQRLPVRVGVRRHERRGRMRGRLLRRHRLEQMHDLRQAYQLIPNRFEEREERLRVEGSSQAELEHLGERVLDGTRLDDLFQ